MTPRLALAWTAALLALSALPLAARVQESCSQAPASSGAGRALTGGFSPLVRQNGVEVLSRLDSAAAAPGARLAIRNSNPYDVELRYDVELTFTGAPAGAALLSGATFPGRCVRVRADALAADVSRNTAFSYGSAPVAEIRVTNLRVTRAAPRTAWGGDEAPRPPAVPAGAPAPALPPVWTARPERTAIVTIGDAARGRTVDAATRSPAGEASRVEGKPSVSVAASPTNRTTATHAPVPVVDATGRGATAPERSRTVSAGPLRADTARRAAAAAKPLPSAPDLSGGLTAARTDPGTRPATAAAGPWRMLQTVLRIVLGTMLCGAAVLLVAPLALSLSLVAVNAGRTLLRRPVGA
ncbi:MAG TPA: hypothetical protein VF263_16700 [Longimicrobiaceae bacterium]